MLETAFAGRPADADYDSEVYLGLDFHAATVRLPQNADPFQTTPGDYTGLSFKVPGFRCVRRWDTSVRFAFVRRVSGEWRICEQHESEATIPVNVPADALIDALA